MNQSRPRADGLVRTIVAAPHAASTLSTLHGIIAAGFALTIPTRHPQGRNPSFPPDTGKGEGSLPSPFCCQLLSSPEADGHTHCAWPEAQKGGPPATLRVSTEVRGRTAGMPLCPGSALAYEPITSRQILRNCASVSKVCCTRPCHLTLSVMSFTWSSVALSPCWSR